jgi:branched-chain amino acid transport system substrate-binding protein
VTRVSRPRAVALAVLLAFGAACSGDSSGPTTTSSPPTTARQCAHAADQKAAPFAIGLVDTVTGGASFPGPRDGAKAAVAYANCELGGLGGHPLTVTTCDAGPDAASETACGSTLAADANVRLVLTGYLFAPDGLYPPLAFAAKPVLGGIPLTAGDLNAEGVRFYSAGTPGVVTGLVDLAKSKLGAGFTSAVVVVSDDSVVPLIQPALAAAGVLAPVVEANNPDLAAALTAAGADHAPAVIALVDQPGCAAVAKAKAAAPNATFFTTSLCYDQAVVDAVGLDAMQGWYFVGERPFPGVEPGVAPGVDQYNANFERYADTPPTEPGAIAGWTNVLDAIAALSSTPFERLDGPTVAAALGGYHGPQAPGGGAIACPGKPYPTLCGRRVFATRLDNGKLPVLIGLDLAPA